jgi:hypothetical protein
LPGQSVVRPTIVGAFAAWERAFSFVYQWWLIVSTGGCGPTRSLAPSAPLRVTRWTQAGMPERFTARSDLSGSSDRDDHDGAAGVVEYALGDLAER